MAALREAKKQLFAAAEAGGSPTKAILRICTSGEGGKPLHRPDKRWQGRATALCLPLLPLSANADP